MCLTPKILHPHYRESARSFIAQKHILGGIYFFPNLYNNTANLCVCI